MAGKASPSKCTVGGQATASEIGTYLGIDAGTVDKKVARLLCAGGTDVADQAADYRGHPSCRAAAAVTGGGKACRWGCLGLADCEVACTFGAISMSPTLLPVVDADKCTGCEDCVKSCPKGLFEMAPIEQRLIVQCKSLLEGDEVLAACRVGCNACGRCAADAPKGLIEMRDNLPVIHRDKLALQTEKATRRCPTGAIVWIDRQQFPQWQKAEPKHVG